MANEIDFEELSGKKVLSQDGMNVGEVASFVLDTESWTVLSLVIKVNRDTLAALKLRRPLLGSQKIIIPVNEVSGVGNALVLKSKLDALVFYGGDPAEKSEKPQVTLPPSNDPPKDA